MRGRRSFWIGLAERISSNPTAGRGRGEILVPSESTGSAAGTELLPESAIGFVAADSGTVHALRKMISFGLARMSLSSNVPNPAPCMIELACKER